MVPTEVKPLTQADLQTYWQQVIDSTDNPKLQELMKNVELELREHGLFHIIATNSLFETEFRPFMVKVLEQLRQKTQMPMLNSKVIVHLPEKEAMLYNANEKYAELQRRNPDLAKLREIFHEIDI